MAKKKSFGSWVFLIAVLVAFLAGLFNSLTNNFAIGVLVILGLVIGLLDITGKESSSFLLSSAVLVIVTSFGRNVLNTIPRMVSVLDALLILVVPAAIVVALKTIYKLAKN